ncbi:MAG: caspase family protein [Saprospiraceae bacterium]
MISKYSLNIGLNTVDSNKLKGKYNILNNAEHDANYYSDYAQSRGFETSKLIGKQATSSSFFSEITKIKNKMNEKDLFFISFSGHGTRVKDLNSDEEEGDGYDEALVFYDRIVIDDELRNIWESFRNNSRILFLTDSCYNGKVSRLFELLANNFSTDLSKRTFRGVDIENSEIDILNNIGFYSGIKLFHNSNENNGYSLIHIASCQNNQFADDGNNANKTSYFTGVFKEVIDKEKFSGNYRKLYEKLSDNMPPWQSPDWDNHSESKPNNFESTKAFE